MFYLATYAVVYYANYNIGQADHCSYSQRYAADVK